MIYNNDVKQRGVQDGGPRIFIQGTQGGGVPPPFSVASRAFQPRRRRLGRIMLVIVLLGVLLSSIVVVAANISRTSEQFYVRIGNQQPALVDLRQSLPVSPYLLGVNVFPQAGTD